MTPSLGEPLTHSTVSASSAASSATELITYIIPDFNAVAYFQREFEQLNEFHLIEYTKTSGFDIYLVEQWVNNRNIGTLISTYTGNLNNEVSVVKFTTTKKPSKYYPLRFQEYLNELVMNQAKIKLMDRDEEQATAIEEANNEYLFITNITTLPSHLSLIPVLGGDVRLVLNDFVINSNLKKLKCSGRSISLVTPKISDANEDKFRQMYKIYNLSIPIKFAIKELVNIIQTSLFYFDLLDAKYCDGLLCNKTDEAIMNWWNLIGLPHFNVKPNHRNGILPSRTVAAIISLIVSIKIRLQLFGGCDVPKDPFDFENFMISIGQFQRQVKLDKRRKLDIETVNKLFYLTNDKDKYSEFEELNALTPTHISRNSSTNDLKGLGLGNSGTSPAKKNKSYTKEFRKLTHVVRNSVQDRISTVNRPEDDAFVEPNPNKTAVRLRDRLAKLGESTNPRDVETLDLEELVRNYLVGKTLRRLWYGLSDSDTGDHKEGGKSPHIHSSPIHHHHTLSITSSPINNHHRHSPRSPQSPRVGLHAQSKLYNFVSLKEAITNTQKIYYDSSRNGRGLNRMKLGLLRNLMLNQQKKLYNNQPNHLIHPRAMEHFNPHLNSGLSQVDALLKIPSEYSESTNNLDRRQSKSPVDSKFFKDDDEADEVSQFSRSLNRRNSYPFIRKVGENNLNLLEWAQVEEAFERPAMPKRNSFSFIEEYENDLVTIESLSRDYLKDMMDLIVFDNRKKMYQQEDNEMNNIVLAKKYQDLNYELKKIRARTKQLDNNKTRILNEELPKLIEINMNNLSTNIDRLVYESKIITKRINELETSCKFLRTKVKEQNRDKLNNLINTLIILNRFHRVFKEPTERNELILKLTGGDEELLQQILRDREAYTQTSTFRIIAMFIWDMIMFIFHLFKFDRSNMNLDRIRETWNKLDPNRTYITKAYQFVGHDTDMGRSHSLQRSSSKRSN